MADFSELKAAIRQDIKDNTEQEITGDVLQGDLLRMVDDINAAKADTAVVEDLGRQVSDKVGDAPADGLLYGRKNGSWLPIALISGLVVTINHPEGVYDSDYTVVVRAAGTEERYTYTGAGMAISVPAGAQVTVSVIAPAGFTSPRSMIYTSNLGVTQIYTGASVAIVDGIYILDTDGNYTPYAEWNIADNARAVGVGVYVGSDINASFVVSTKYASQTTPNEGSISQTYAFFGINGDQPTGLLGAATVADAQTLDCWLQNNPILIQQHAIGQPDWETAQTITNNGGAGFAPLAACCARFRSNIDGIGTWKCPDAKKYKFYENNKDNDFALAYKKINNNNYDLIQTAFYFGTCTPRSDNATLCFYFRNDAIRVDGSRSATVFSAHPIRPFFV